MRIKKAGIEFKAKMDVVCRKCGAHLEIDASDLQMPLKPSDYGFLTFKCGHCKRTQYISEGVIGENMHAEYQELLGSRV